MGTQLIETLAVAGFDQIVNRDCQSNAETILLVEDEGFVREVTSEVLGSAGYNVLVATDSEAALDILLRLSSRIGLLLTDMILPGQSGRSLAATARGINPKIRVLFITGYAEQMVMDSNGQGACLPKPFSSESLLGKVRELLDWNVLREAIPTPA